jgi:glycosyltransferase involved in cell wall biosynthesis
MVYPPNVKAVVDFCRDCLPLIRKEIPGASLSVVGGNPVQQVKDLAADPLVTVTGAVEDTRPRVWEAQVSICPVSLGAGRQNKVLESFALGVPVAASRLAAEGVEAVDGKHLLAADGPRAFAQAVVRLCRDRSLAARVARGGLELVQRHHDWERSTRQVEKALVRLSKREGIGR